jgi:two-component system sensor histidine kinase PilS (NtrC family)
MALTLKTRSTQPSAELSRHLLTLIVIRAIVLLLGLNLADRFELLPERIGTVSFLLIFNSIVLALTLICLVWWQNGWHKRFQLYFQIGTDLMLTSILVAYTGGVQSSFVSFYLLVIIYCSLTLGRNGGMVGAALSTLLYAGIIAAYRSGFGSFGNPSADLQQTTFRISAHVIGFFAVAYLGTYLHQRLQMIEGELKEKINSLKELQQLNEHIVSSIRSGLITTDLDGRIAVFNAAAGELTDSAPQKMMDRPVQHLIGNELWERIVNGELLHNLKALRHEQWIDLPNGSKRFLGFSVSPLHDQKKESLGYIISFQDLTEIIRLEEEVRLKDRMAAIGRMAAGIAHEIRNPLTAMRGSVEILRSHAKLPETDDRLLNILIRESDRLNKFIEDFLSFARPRKYEKRRLNLIPVLKDSVTLLKNSPELKGKYAVHLKIDASEIPIVGSADQLNQVFWNLAQNAFRAMPNGGELNISIEKTPDGTGHVLFQDTGIGMNREEKEQIFQPFHSGYSGGLGLGLSIIFQIMEDHGGKISFESERGTGTEVHLSFPLEKQSSAPLLAEQTA